METECESHIIRFRLSSTRLFAGLRRRLRFVLGAGAVGWLTTGTTTAGVVVVGGDVVVVLVVVVLVVVVVIVFVLP